MSTATCYLLPATCSTAKPCLEEQRRHALRSCLKNISVPEAPSFSIATRSIEEQSNHPQLQPQPWNASLILGKLDALSELPEMMESFRTEFKKEIRDIKESLDYLYKEIAEWKSKGEQNETEIKLLRADLNKERKNNAKLKNELFTLKQRVNLQENYSRRYNLLFDGVKEEQEENYKQIIMDLFATEASGHRGLDY